MTIDNINELISWTPSTQEAIISDGILLPETSMIIFGPAKAWKSILALHTCYCIAMGSDWFGFHTAKSTAFKYQVELPKAIDRKRVIKYMNGKRPDNMFFKTSPYSKIDSSYGKQSLERDIETVMSRNPDNHLVLVLDPIYLLITGHISDDYDIKKLLDNINEIKAKYHISVIIIHHTHKTRVDSSGNVIDLGSEEIMGSSYFNNWADSMLRIKLLNPYTGSDTVELSFGLLRHAESVLPKFQVKWSRANLQPRVIKREAVAIEEISIRDIDEID